MFFRIAFKAPAAAEVTSALRVSAVGLAVALTFNAAPALARDPVDPLTAYVKARAADADGAGALAAQGYALALAATPGAESVAFRAYRQGIETGNIDLIRASVAAMDAAGTAPADVAIFQFADAARARDLTAADAALARMKKGPLDFLVPALSAWVVRERGGDPFPALETPADNPIAGRYSAEARILLLIAAKRHDEAQAALAALEGGQAGIGPNIGLRIAAARLFAGTGKRSMIATLLPGKDRSVTRLRREIRSGHQADMAFGTARLYSRLATDLTAESTLPLAVLLARSAAMLAPEDDAVRVQLASLLGRTGATERALALVRGVEADAPFAAMARQAELRILTDAGRGAEAIAIAAEASAARGAGAGEAQMLGDLLSTAGRNADAAAAYALAIERSAGNAGWALYLQQGGALERAGAWDRALPLLERAVELAPDQPNALNYLGYAQAERGENLDAAKGLLERASKLAPDDAAITDSLGWAYYMTGAYDRAVPLLQRAAQAEPADVEINEHLGDALWQVGRRFEARYAWAAASVYAGAEDAARIEGKIATGLTPETSNR